LHFVAYFASSDLIEGLNLFFNAYTLHIHDKMSHLIN